MPRQAVQRRYRPYACAQNWGISFRSSRADDDLMMMMIREEIQISFPPKCLHEIIYSGDHTGLKQFRMTEVVWTKIVVKYSKAKVEPKITWHVRCKNCFTASMKRIRVHRDHQVRIFNNFIFKTLNYASALYMYSSYWLDWKIKQ